MTTRTSPTGRDSNSRGDAKAAPHSTESTTTEPAPTDPATAPTAATAITPSTRRPVWVRVLVVLLRQCSLSLH